MAPAFAGTGLGGFNERVEPCAGVGAGYGVGEQPVSSSEAERSDGVLDGVGVDAVAAVVTEAGQGVPLVVEVAQGLAQGGGGQHLGAGVVEPGAQCIEHRDGLGLPGAQALVGRLVADAAFDGVEGLDAP